MTRPLVNLFIIFFSSAAGARAAIDPMVQKFDVFSQAKSVRSVCCKFVSILKLPFFSQRPNLFSPICTLAQTSWLLLSDVSKMPRLWRQFCPLFFPSTKSTSGLQCSSCRLLFHLPHRLGALLMSPWLIRQDLSTGQTARSYRSLPKCRRQITAASFCWGLTHVQPTNK